jgi:hypothetical protein
MGRPERSTRVDLLADLNPMQQIQVRNLVVGELREAAIGIRGAASAVGGDLGGEDPVIKAALWLLEGMQATIEEVMQEMVQRDELSRQQAQEAEWRSGKASA